MGGESLKTLGSTPKKINGSAVAENMIQNFMKPKFATAILVVVTAVYKCRNMGTSASIFTPDSIKLQIKSKSFYI